MHVQPSESKSEASGSRETISEKLRLNKFDKKTNNFYSLMNTNLEKNEFLGIEEPLEDIGEGLRLARLNPITREARGLERNNSV